jgi:hypothetical protein
VSYEKAKTPALVPGFLFRELLPAIGVAVRAIRIGLALSCIRRPTPALRTGCRTIGVIAAFGVHAGVAVRLHLIMMVRAGRRKARCGSRDQQGRRRCQDMKLFHCRIFQLVALRISPFPMAFHPIALI